MKTTLLFFVAVLTAATTFSYGQEMYSIEKKGSKYSQDQINEAFHDANFCGLVNPSEKYVINFDDGTSVSIKSFKDLSQEKISFEEGCVRTTDFQDGNGIVWLISAKNTLLKTQTSNPVKKIGGAQRDNQ